MLTVPVGFFANVSAQRSAAGGGTIHCKIQIDGQTWKRVTASGPCAIMDCSGTVGGD